MSDRTFVKGAWWNLVPIPVITYEREHYDPALTY
jgi:hypothetical protein